MVPRATSYRYPRERSILLLTLVSVLAVIALTATATLCLSAVFVLVAVALSYWISRSHHRALLRNAQESTPRNTPALAALAAQTAHVLDVPQYQVFVVHARQLNAYTFGLAPPQVVVINEPMFQVMDEGELRFVIGHEMGHIRLGHTWLNSLVGGMAGIPSPFGAAAFLAVVFLWWNRACEYSADRAGLLACGKPHKAKSALVKLVAGGSPRSHAELERLLHRIDAEDDTMMGNLGEALSTHPMTIKRIEQLERYAASEDFRRQMEWIAKHAAL